MNKHLILAVAFVMMSAGGVMAGGGSFTGKWPVTISKTHSLSDGTYCVMLNDDGSLGRKHSGEAELTGGFQNPTDGQFEVIGNTFVATIDVPSDQGSLGFIVITAQINKGKPGKGIFDYANGSQPDEGDAVFGFVGGC
jgi:hypothetical protein